jgi:general secretion pathway protein G
LLVALLIVLGVLLLLGFLSLQAGNTCMETIVTVGILALLAVIALPIVGRAIDKVKAMHELEDLAAAVNHFYDDCGRYPTNDEGLGALIVKPDACETWRSYLDVESIPQDPWGNEYIYTRLESDSAAAFTIVSHGRELDESEDDISVSGSPSRAP